GSTGARGSSPWASLVRATTSATKSGSSPCRNGSEIRWVVQKRPGEVELGAEPLGQGLHAERFRGVVPRVEDVQAQLLGVEKRVVRPFTGDVGVEAQGGGLPDHRARRSRHDTHAPHALRPEPHETSAPAHDISETLRQGRARDVDLSPHADPQAVLLPELPPPRDAEL